MNTCNHAAIPYNGYQEPWGAPCRSMESLFDLTQQCPTCSKSLVDFYQEQSPAYNIAYQGGGLIEPSTRGWPPHIFSQRPSVAQWNVSQGRNPMIRWLEAPPRSPIRWLGDPNGMLGAEGCNIRGAWDADTVWNLQLASAGGDNLAGAKWVTWMRAALGAFGYPVTWSGPSWNTNDPGNKDGSTLKKYIQSFDPGATSSNNGYGTWAPGSWPTKDLLIHIQNDLKAGYSPGGPPILWGFDAGSEKWFPPPASGLAPCVGIQPVTPPQVVVPPPQVVVPTTCVKGSDCGPGKFCSNGKCVDKCPSGQKPDKDGVCKGVSTAGMGAGVGIGIAVIIAAVAGYFAIQSEGG